MEFINRHQELGRLRQLTQAKTSGTGVLWGRRRVGKTRLLLEWASESNGVYYVADESAPQIQRKFMALALEERLPGFSKVDYPDWQSLLARLAQDAVSRGWHGPFVIDEIPYLFATSPELPSVLQNFIDHAAKKSGIILLLSGSSQRMMQSAILDESAPLYGRADQVMQLKPIAIGYLGQALGLTNARDIVEAYSVWGGVPRYWELAQKTPGTLLEKIDQLVLDPMGPLSEEPQRLLREESPSAINLRPILDAIGMGAHRLSEVASRTGTPITALTRPVERLLQLDLIEREVCYGSSPKDSKKTLYKIKDPFLRFWFNVVAPRRSFFSQMPSRMRLTAVKDCLSSLFSETWEELCRAAISAEHGPAGRYWEGKGHEWDILSESYDHRHFLIGESKWTQNNPSLEWVEKHIQELKNKGIPPVHRPEKAKLTYAFFLPEVSKSWKISEDIRLMGAQDVIDILLR